MRSEVLLLIRNDCSIGGSHPLLKGSLLKVCCIPHSSSPLPAVDHLLISPRCRIAKVESSATSQKVPIPLCSEIPFSIF